MQVTAHLKSLRIAPRKVRLMTRVIKGLDAVAARHQLAFFPKGSSKSLGKLLESALSNAQNNFSLVKDNLRVKDVIVNGGPVLKRFEPKGFGSVSPIAKRTSQVTIVLEEKVPGLKSEKKASVTQSHTDFKKETTEAKPEVKKEIGRREGRIKAFTKRFFRRKSI